MTCRCRCRPGPPGGGARRWPGHRRGHLALALTGLTAAGQGRRPPAPGWRSPRRSSTDPIGGAGRSGASRRGHRPGHGPSGPGQCHSTARPTATPNPTATMTHRRTGAGRRRPYRPPTWPPMIDPAAISAGHRPRDVGGGDEEDAGHGVDREGQGVLRAVEPLQVVVDEDGQQGDQDDALGRPEVAAVDAGQEDARPSGPAPPCARRRAPALEERRSSGAGRAISTAATAMRTGTAALNTLWGSPSRSMAPINPPSRDAEPSWRSRSPLAGQLPAVGHGGADVARDQADVVGHVGQHRRVAQGEQGGEGDQRARADDDVDRARGQSGGEDGQGIQRGHGEGLAAHRPRRSRPGVAADTAGVGRTRPGGRRTGPGRRTRPRSARR